MAEPGERFLSHLIAKIHDHFLSFLNDLNDSFQHYEVQYLANEIFF